jgi:hypothetical protein
MMLRITTHTHLLLLIITLLFFSCKQEEITPPISEQKSFSDTNSAKEAASKLYKVGLSKLYFDTDAEEGVTLAWSAYLSGLIESEARTAYYPALNAQKLNSPEVQKLAQKLSDECMKGITLADSVILRLPQTQGLAADEQAQLLGEAHFFRAFNRFYLLRTFGVIPTIHEEQKKSLEKSYRFIEQDLQRSIALLPSREKIPTPFRVSQDVARALLGEVYLQMSGYPLQQARYKEAVAILSPIVSSGKYHLMANGSSEEQSAFNKLRTQPHCEEYLFTFRGESSTPLAAYAFPYEAKAWGTLGTSTTFNAFKPTQLLMSAYGETDLRGKDRQYFHTFYKVSEGGKTVFEIFDPAPWFWIQSTVESIGNKQVEIGLYPYSEVLLMLAEALLNYEEGTNTAVSYLAEVRARALQSEVAEVTLALAPLSKEKLQEEIWLERLRELPFQMKQLWDIQRTRKYPKLERTGLRFVPLAQSQTPQGHQLNPLALYLPLPTP